MGKQIVLSLGSNKGNAFLNISCALDCMRSFSQFQLLWQSKMNNSEDEFQRSTSHYSNQIVYGVWDSSIESLLFAIKKWEKKCGRQNRPRWQAREIDIDVLFVFPHLQELYQYVSKSKFSLNSFLSASIHSSFQLSLGHLCLPHQGIFRAYLQELWKQWHFFITQSIPDGDVESTK